MKRNQSEKTNMHEKRPTKETHERETSEFHVLPHKAKTWKGVMTARNSRRVHVSTN